MYTIKTQQCNLWTNHSQHMVTPQKTASLKQHTLRVGLADSGYLLATLGGRMSRRRGIADSVSESAPVADSAIIFGNA